MISLFARDVLQFVGTDVKPYLLGTLHQMVITFWFLYFVERTRGHALFSNLFLTNFFAPTHN
jgi:hypothetical protein